MKTPTVLLLGLLAGSPFLVRSDTLEARVAKLEERVAALEQQRPAAPPQAAEERPWTREQVKALYFACLAMIETATPAALAKVHGSDISERFLKDFRRVGQMSTAATMADEAAAIGHMERATKMAESALALHNYLAKVLGLPERQQDSPAPKLNPLPKRR